MPYFLFDAFSIFLLRQFMLTIPQSYVDAARVDGCSEFQALVRIIVPMAKPGIAATALFCFLFTWNDYFGPLLYTGEVQGPVDVVAGAGHRSRACTSSSGTRRWRSRS